MLKKTTRVVLMGGALLASLNVMASSGDDAKYRAALIQVKAGQYNQGLPILKQLMLQNPTVSRYRYDYLATLGWAQRDDEVLALSRTWSLDSSTPIYVLEAIGRSARNKRDYARAVEAYSVALKQDPRRKFSLVGRALAKLGLGDVREAEVLLPELAKDDGFRQELERGFLDYYLSRPELYDKAVQFMTQLRQRYPNHPAYKQQEVTVLAWVGRSSQALERAQALSTESFPSYVLETLGRSARDLKQYPVALHYYEAAIKKDSTRPDALVGYVMTLLDSIDVRRQSTQSISGAEERQYIEREKKQLNLALGLLEPLNPLQQPRLDVKEAWLRLQDTVRLDDYKILMAARAIQERHNPKHLGAATAEIDALNRQGAPHLASLHPLFNQVREALRWDVKLNMVGQEVRAGQENFQAQTGDARYQKSEEAIKHAEQIREDLLKADFPEKQKFVDRLDYDRMIALNDVRRYSEVIELHKDLEARNVSMPYYAYVAVASAYLNTKNPAKARDLFQKALELKPRDPIASVGLHYAYLDNGQYEEALYVANWELPLASRDARNYAAMTYAYNQYLSEAEQRMEALVKEFPADYALHRDLARIHLYRGKPRQADERYKWVAGAVPDDYQVHVGRVATNLAMQDYREAEKSLEKAEALAPREDMVKKARRDLNMHNLRELSVTAGYSHGNPAGANSGEHAKEPSLSWRVYSQPLNYDFRVFTEGGYISEEMPATTLTERDANGNPQVVQRTGFKTKGYYAAIGADYRHLGHSAELSLGGTDYRNDTPADNGVISSKRMRVAGAYKYQFNDQWSVDSVAEWNAANSALSGGGSSVSLRSSREGVRANRLLVGATWAANESRRARLGLDFTKFSDGNRRWAWFSGWTEQLITRPTYRLTASVDVRIEGNSAPSSSVSYYNPERETYAGATLTQEWVIDQLYERSWKHRLGVSLGKIYQKGYSGKRAEGVRYDHIVNFSDRTNLEVGWGRNRRYYDGQPDYISNVSSTLNWRF